MPLSKENHRQLEREYLHKKIKGNLANCKGGTNKGYWYYSFSVRFCRCIINLSSLVSFLSISESSLVSTPWATVAPTSPVAARLSAEPPAVSSSLPTLPTMPSISSSGLVATTASSLRSRFSLSLRYHFNSHNRILFLQFLFYLWKRAISKCNGALSLFSRSCRFLLLACVIAMCSPRFAVLTTLWISSSFSAFHVRSFKK